MNYSYVLYLSWGNDVLHKRWADQFLWSGHDRLHHLSGSVQNSQDIQIQISELLLKEKKKQQQLTDSL